MLFYILVVGYNAQAEYHSENAMAIMQTSVTTTNGEREKADVFEILFRINYVLGKAKMALKKFNEADTALLKVLDFSIDPTLLTPSYGNHLFVYHFVLNYPCTKVILLSFCIPKVVKSATKILKMG